ncbi:hypothetical protein, unlikely [Trypanosoma brucei brucei TREU927]|uniref:Uncharacterized protein n=1 Tax=Trypanosoma brucei brucei (strain 927/4 GUTat10.1) TaxID=185431 RepID=Q38CQ4_TRYB2|nr:hypothetical protein, unlikely [Trypanosoma brucei brucei TREU927]EAN77416.1 hypothetical protein, unlikely [Trypanosoma brucei brucei TREU927]
MWSFTTRTGDVSGFDASMDLTKFQLFVSVTDIFDTFFFHRCRDFSARTFLLLYIREPLCAFNLYILLLLCQYGQFSCPKRWRFFLTFLCFFFVAVRMPLATASFIGSTFFLDFLNFYTIVTLYTFLNFRQFALLQT